MKRIFPVIIIAGMLVTASARSFAQDGSGSGAGESRWSGPYVGAKIGVNDATFGGVGEKSTYTTGLEAGYLVNLNGPVVGLDGFADFNPEKTHAPGIEIGSHVYGVDLKLGLDNGPLMPYVKAGFAHVHGTGAVGGSGSGFHGGLGVEYQVVRGIGVDGEWTYDRASLDGGTLTNNNFTLGANVHF
ncbi:MAG: outer membrane beta-barrel protein [Acidiferrobacteraceae bacterium]